MLRTCSILLTAKVDATWRPIWFPFLVTNRALKVKSPISTVVLIVKKPNTGVVFNAKIFVILSLNPRYARNNISGTISCCIRRANVGKSYVIGRGAHLVTWNKILTLNYCWKSTCILPCNNSTRQVLHEIYFILPRNTSAWQGLHENIGCYLAIIQHSG